MLDKLKPLVLKLRNPDRKYLGFGGAIKPEQNIEQMIDSLGQELLQTLTEHVNGLRDQVKQARPQPGEDQFEQRMAAYTELANSVTQLIRLLSDAVTQSLAEFQQLINELWDEMQKCVSEEQTERVVEGFHKKTEDLFRRLLSEGINPKRDLIKEKLAAAQ